MYFLIKNSDISDIGGGGGWISKSDIKWNKGGGGIENAKSAQ